MPSSSHNGTISISTEGSGHRRLAAIMFTDIKGFSSLMESDESTAVGLVKAQREIIRKHIALGNGEERETIGDAFLVLFDSAVNAVRCAIEIQREICEFNQSREVGKQVWVRVGIHLGDILIEEGSVFGEGVNLAARVEPLADPGGICITRQVYDQIKHVLDVSVARLTVRELKNLTDIPDIYRILLPTSPPQGPIPLMERLRWFVQSRSRLALTISLVLVAVGGSAYWNFFALHASLAREVAFIRHAPVPIDAISRGYARKLDHYYEFKSRMGRIVWMHEVKKPDLLPEDAQKAWEFQLAKKPQRDYPIHEFVYRGGDVREERVYDRLNVLKYTILYEKDGTMSTVHDRAGFIKTFENQIASFNYKLDEKGRIAEQDNRNAFGMLRSDLQGAANYRYAYDSRNLPVEISSFDIYGNLVEDKDGVAMTVLTYDKDGRPASETYFDRYKAVRESQGGAATVRKTYDDLGRLTLEQYEDRSGQPLADNSGACARKFSYGDNGRLLEITALSCALAPKATKDGFASRRYEYENGLVAAESFLDEKGEATADNRGIASIRAKYDSAGHIAEVSFFGIGGKKVTDDNNAHTVQYSYDELGQPTRRVFLDADGKPVINGNGYAEMRVHYDSRGDANEWAYFDTDGQMVNSNDGYAVVRNEYDQFGNLVSKSFFDKRNDPAMGREDACHLVKIKYDEGGNLAETRCYDGSNKLTPGIKHCAISKYTYDAYGKLTRFECYIDEGKLIDEPNLPSVLSIKYDSRGYTAEVQAFNAQGELADRYQGAAIWKRKSDSFGNQLEVSTYDRNGHLINNPKYKAAIFRREFDSRGHELRAQAFDQDGKPTKGVWGFAEVRSKYDERGHKTSESYFDEEGRPTLNWQGVHEYKMTYDSNGRLSEIANIGNFGDPINSEWGLAFTRNTYNQYGQITKTEFLDVQQNPVKNLGEACASEEFTNDDRGNVLEIKRSDVSGELCRDEGCIAITSQQFDSKGRMIRQIFKDADGNPDLDENGAAGFGNEYDIQGRISLQRVLNSEGKQGKDKNGVEEYILRYRPDTGALWFIMFADKDGKPASAGNGADIRITLYDPVYNERQKARVDATLSGKVISIACLDAAGNETGEKNCTDGLNAKGEIEKIRSAFTAAVSSPPQANP